MHRVTINILCLVTHLVTELFRDAIPNTLMWPVLVEKLLVAIKDMLQPAQPWNDQMIKTLSPNATHPSLRMCIRIGRLKRCFYRFNACLFQHSIKVSRITTIIIAKEESRFNTEFLAFPENVTNLLFKPLAVGRERRLG